MIIGVDFDQTLSMGDFPGTGPANENLIRFLVTKKMQGDKVILWTCRNGKPLEDAVRFCEKNGLYFDAVNDNLPEIIEQYGSNSRKITCDVYIDDKAVSADNYEMVGDVDLDKISAALVRFADKLTALSCYS